MMLWHRKYHRFTFYNRRTGTGNVLPCPCPCPENGFKKHLFRLFTSDLETRDPRAPCLGLASAGFTLVFQIAQNITTCLFIQHRCCVDDDGQCCIWGHHQITQCPAQPPALASSSQSRGIPVTARTSAQNTVQRTQHLKGLRRINADLLHQCQFTLICI